jgi:hypothetical protein
MQCISWGQINRLKMCWISKTNNIVLECKIKSWLNDNILNKRINTSILICYDQSYRIDCVGNREGIGRIGNCCIIAILKNPIPFDYRHSDTC